MRSWEGHFNGDFQLRHRFSAIPHSPVAPQGRRLHGPKTHALQGHGWLANQDLHSMGCRSGEKECAARICPAINVLKAFCWYNLISFLDLPKFNNFRTLGIVGSKSGQKGANGTNCANWIKRSEIVWNIMQHDKHAGWWWNMMKPPKPYTIKSKWLGAYSSPKHIQSNITKHPLWGHPLPKVRPAPLLCALFFCTLLQDLVMRCLQPQCVMGWSGSKAQQWWWLKDVENALKACSILGHAALASVFSTYLVKHVALVSGYAMGSCRRDKRQSPQVATGH